MSNDANNQIARPPVIAVMGHVDHGKSTLLDYIRQTNVVAKEAGGITQHISAYEVEHNSDGQKRLITFLDTPGHEAFKAIRTRGAKAADIAILVVSAEDGVKTQTLEALECLKENNVPFIVAVNKIDKPNANVEQTKQNLAENEIYLEGYGGKTPWAAISAKSGQGIPELLDLILLVADLEDLKANKEAKASGVIIESNLDTKKGIVASAVIKNGTLHQGDYVVAENSFAPVRIFENFLGKSINEASFSSPVRIIGWSILPTVGATFETVADKKTAEKAVSEFNTKQQNQTTTVISTKADETHIIPLIIKADAGGSLEAVLQGIEKITHERARFKIILSGIGDITENDIKTASGTSGTMVIGFHVGIDSRAKNLAERMEIEPKIFTVIYHINEWLEEVINSRAPKISVEETVGEAKVLKLFSQTKNNQVIGARLETGSIKKGAMVKIIRRDNEIGKGKIKELQQQKVKTSEIGAGEFGTMVDSSTVIAPGDKLIAFTVVEK